MNLLKRIITKSVIGAAIAAAPMVSLSSCDGAIYEDLDPCRSGIEVRFVYDYNMLFANAFYSQVDCLTLFVYDSDSVSYTHLDVYKRQARSGKVILLPLTDLWGSITLATWISPTSISSAISSATSRTIATRVGMEVWASPTVTHGSCRAIGTLRLR